MTKDDLFRGLAKMEGYSHLTEGAEVLLHLLIEGADVPARRGEGDLERWRELMQLSLKSVWSASYKALEELKEAGFIRGYFGKAGRGTCLAVFSDALLEAVQGEEK